MPVVRLLGGAAASRGSVTVKVVPRPGVLWTLM
jgi:hypothetical protein